MKVVGTGRVTIPLRRFVCPRIRCAGSPKDRNRKDREDFSSIRPPKSEQMRDISDRVPAEMTKGAKFVKAVLPHLDIHSKWKSLASRYKLLIATGLAYVICNMVATSCLDLPSNLVQDKVNMSVVIIPMAKEYGWTATVSGLIQSAFFYGYMLFQLPSGYLNTRFAGARMLPIGVGLWSTMTAAIPLLGTNMFGLSACRALVGAGESLAPGSLTDMVASIVPLTERSRSMSSVGSALYVGTLLGLLLSPIIVDAFGWQTVFYAFGGVGIVWSVWWVFLLREIKADDPFTYNQLLRDLDFQGRETDGKKSIPWRAMLRCKAVLALIYVHFCQNWFHFSIIAWLPTYFSDTLNMNLAQASQASLMPPIAAISASLIAGPLADFMTASGYRVGVVRKVVQCIALLGPSVCLLAACYPPLAKHSPFFLTCALGLTSFSLAGLYCNHQDLSPAYSSILLGMTNTAGALPGMLGVAATGIILDMTGSWNIALFLPSILFFVTGSIVFILFGSGEQMEFTDNAPFAIERMFGRK